MYYIRGNVYFFGELHFNMQFTPLNSFYWIECKQTISDYNNTVGYHFAPNEIDFLEVW